MLRDLLRPAAPAGAPRLKPHWKQAPAAPLSARHHPDTSPRHRPTSSPHLASARHAENTRQVASVLHENANKYGHVHANSEVVGLLRENAALEEKNRMLSERIIDLEKSIQRLWQRGRHPAAPSTKGLRTMTHEAQQAMERERLDAEEARRDASDQMRQALQARSDAFVSLAQLHEANQALETEKSAMREWHANDAGDLSRRMADVTQQLSQERHKCDMLQRDIDHLQQMRTDDVSRLVAQLEEVRAEHAQQSRQQHEETRRLSEELEGARMEWTSLSGEAAYEKAQLQDELRRGRESVDRQRELSAGSSVVMNAQLAKLSAEADESKMAAERMRRDLEESRDNYAKLAVTRTHRTTFCAFVLRALMLCYYDRALLLLLSLCLTTHPAHWRRNSHYSRYRQTRARRSWR